MPIPKVREDITDIELEKKYIKLGWSKDITIDWVVFNPGTKKSELLKYRFVANTMACTANKGQDAQYQMTFVQQMPTGVSWTCGICGKTYGPLAWEDGVLQSTETISENRVWEIIKRTGQHPPVGLDKPPAKRGRVIRTR